MVCNYTRNAVSTVIVDVIIIFGNAEVNNSIIENCVHVLLFTIMLSAQNNKIFCNQSCS